MSENSENYKAGETSGPSGSLELDLFGMVTITGTVDEHGNIHMPADELLMHCLRIFKGRLMTLAGIYYKQSEGE